MSLQPLRHHLIAEKLSVANSEPNRLRRDDTDSVSTSLHCEGVSSRRCIDVVLPQKPAGSASATHLFGACSAFTHVSACMFARSPKVTFTQSTSTNSLPPSPLWLLPAERPMGRVGFAPTGDRRLSRHTGILTHLESRAVSRGKWYGRVGRNVVPSRFILSPGCPQSPQN